MSGHTDYKLWDGRVGEVFGNLEVLCLDTKNKTRGYVRCRCTCGDVDSYQYRSLLRGSTKSCGCKSSQMKSKAHTTHGLSKTYQYHMWVNARLRAAARGLEFNLEISDVIVPKRCPVFGFVLYDGPPRGHGIRDDAPSLDRRDQGRGYTKDNVAVISWRANRLKNTLTESEARSLLNYISGEMDFSDVGSL